MQASRGAVKVTIISAEALKKKQLDAIQAGVMTMVGAGKSVSAKFSSFTNAVYLEHSNAQYECIFFIYVRVKLIS